MYRIKFFTQNIKEDTIEALLFRLSSILLCIAVVLQQCFMLSSIALLQNSLTSNLLTLDGD